MTDNSDDAPLVVKYAGAEDLAEQIAKLIYPYPQDLHRQETLTYLLGLFAGEIKRSAREA